MPRDRDRLPRVKGSCGLGCGRARNWGLFWEYLAIGSKVVAVIVAVRALTRLRGLCSGSRRGAGRGRCVASRSDAVVVRHFWCVLHRCRDES